VGRSDAVAKGKPPCGYHLVQQVSESTSRWATGKSFVGSSVPLKGETHNARDRLADRVPPCRPTTAGVREWPCAPGARSRTSESVALASHGSSRTSRPLGCVRYNAPSAGRGRSERYEKLLSGLAGRSVHIVTFIERNAIIDEEPDQLSATKESGCSAPHPRCHSKPRSSLLSLRLERLPSGSRSSGGATTPSSRGHSIGNSWTATPAASDIRPQRPVEGR
jgi:hypothetical protein